MKKTIILLLMALVAICANAQLEVNFNGHASIGNASPSSSTMLVVKESSGSSLTGGIDATVTGTNGNKNENDRGTVL